MADACTPHNKWAARSDSRVKFLPRQIARNELCNRAPKIRFFFWLPVLETSGPRTGLADKCHKQKSGWVLHPDGSHVKIQVMQIHQWSARNISTRTCRAVLN
mmetsp:Transcript_15144/g.43241  ORF Transcript_15144/g.43241 Transcript_15144/m.43241 type:complete len:102 (+) Transcript_15144:1122-1427(+)